MTAPPVPDLSIAQLHAITRPELALPEALAWWGSLPVPDGGEAVGFAISARAAVWWRWDGDRAVTRAGQPGALDGAYELVGFDGHRELRWRNESAGRGPAVVLGEDPGLLPAGDDVSPQRPAVREALVHRRVLAGRVALAPGWARLTAARYAPADVPVLAEPGIDADARGADAPVVVLESVEYTVEDDDGNVGVVDARRIRLRLVPHRDLRFDFREE